MMRFSLFKYKMQLFNDNIHWFSHWMAGAETLSLEFPNVEQNSLFSFFFWESNTFLSRFLNLMLVLFHQQRLTPLSWKDNRFYKKKFYATWINSNEFIAYKDETSTIVGWKKYRIHGWMCSFNICRIGFLYYTMEKLVTN